MKALFMGLGSIGTRHLKNLTELCAAREIPLEVVALRTTDKPLPDELTPLVARQERTLPEDESYDLAFVTNPTHQHAIALGNLKGRAEALFIEKPIFEHPGYDLKLLGLGPQQKAYVAAPMRHTALFAALKKHLAEGCVPYSVRATCSSYLPEWRPNTDYRQGYSARQAMGGGVTLDLIHEWDYMYDLFGPPLQSCNMRGKVSALEIDSDDISVYIAFWQNMVGEVHLDYFGRGYHRTLQALCEEGTLLADFGTGTLTLPDGSVEEHGEAPNRRYQREMEYFLNYALAGVGESISSPARALEILKIAVGDTEWEQD